MMSFRKLLPNLWVLTQTSKLAYSDCPTKAAFSKELQDAINSQINEEFNAGFAYLSMACFFGRTSVALPGCEGYFRSMYEEELTHALDFLNYQLMRGGNVQLNTISPPKEQDWGNIIKAITVALNLEITVKQKLTCVYETAEKKQDLNLMDFISSKYIVEQDNSIREIGRLLTRAKRMTSDKNGEFLFDKELYESFVKSKCKSEYK